VAILKFAQIYSHSNISSSWILFQDSSIHRIGKRLYLFCIAVIWTFQPWPVNSAGGLWYTSRNSRLLQCVLGTTRHTVYTSNKKTF